MKSENFNKICYLTEYFEGPVFSIVFGASMKDFFKYVSFVLLVFLSGCWELDQKLSFANGKFNYEIVQRWDRKQLSDERERPQIGCNGIEFSMKDKSITPIMTEERNDRWDICTIKVTGDLEKFNGHSTFNDFVLTNPDPGVYRLEIRVQKAGSYNELLAPFMFSLPDEALQDATSKMFYKFEVTVPEIRETNGQLSRMKNKVIWKVS